MAQPSVKASESLGTVHKIRESSVSLVEELFTTLDREGNYNISALQYHVFDVINVPVYSHHFL